jgi:hypothetical protein
VRSLVFPLGRRSPLLTPVLMPCRMGGVQAKLSETERQVEKARKESATAREAFNTVRKQRSVGRALQHWPLVCRRRKR